MKDKIIAAIAEQLDKLTVFSDDFRKIRFEKKLGARTGKDEYCQEVASEIAEKLLPIVGEKDFPYDELFDHMANEHGLTLIQGELGDIIHIARSGKQKTGWEDAPSWANWKARDKYGAINYFEEEPVMSDEEWYGGKYQQCGEIPYWTNTLEQRPK